MSNTGQSVQLIITNSNVDEIAANLPVTLSALTPPLWLSVSFQQIDMDNIHPVLDVISRLDNVGSLSLDFSEEPFRENGIEALRESSTYLFEPLITSAKNYRSFRLIGLPISDHLLEALLSTMIDIETLTLNSLMLTNQQQSRLLDWISQARRLVKLDLLSNEIALDLHDALKACCEAKSAQFIAHEMIPEQKGDSSSLLLERTNEFDLLSTAKRIIAGFNDLIKDAFINDLMLLLIENLNEELFYQKIVALLKKVAPLDVNSNKQRIKLLVAYFENSHQHLPYGLMKDSLSEMVQQYFSTELEDPDALELGMISHNLDDDGRVLSERVGRSRHRPSVRPPEPPRTSPTEEIDVDETVQTLLMQLTLIVDLSNYPSFANLLVDETIEAEQFIPQLEKALNELQNEATDGTAADNAVALIKELLFPNGWQQENLMSILTALRTELSVQIYTEAPATTLFTSTVDSSGTTIGKVPPRLEGQ